MHFSSIFRGCEAGHFRMDAQRLNQRRGLHVPIAADAREMQEDLALLRHELHREPEIGLELPRTQEKVLKALDGLPFEIILGKDTTSVTAVLRGAAHNAARGAGPGRAP